MGCQHHEMDIEPMDSDTMATECTERGRVSSGAQGAESLIVNGEATSVTAATLADLLTALGYGGQKVATALNGDFVPEKARAGTPIAAGDRVEIVSPRQGG